MWLDVYPLFPGEQTLWFIFSVLWNKISYSWLHLWNLCHSSPKMNWKQIGFLKHERSPEQTLCHHIPGQIQRLPSTEFLIFSNVCGFPWGCLGECNKWELLKEKRMKTSSWAELSKNSWGLHACLACSSLKSCNFFPLQLLIRDRKYQLLYKT